MVTKITSERITFFIFSLLVVLMEKMMEKAMGKSCEQTTAAGFLCVPYNFYSVCLKFEMEVKEMSSGVFWFWYGHCPLHLSLFVGSS